MYKNVASQKLLIFAWDDIADAPKEGDAANITATISLNGGSQTATDDTNPTEVGGGVYYFDLTQGETNTNVLYVEAQSSTADVFIAPVIVYTMDLDAVASAVSTDISTILGNALNNAEVAEEVWTYATRSLTVSLASAASMVSGGIVSIIRGDDNRDVAITVGDITGYAEIWVTAKTASSYKTETDDTAAVIQWQETVGLIRLNGGTTTASYGSIDVVDASTGLLHLDLLQEASKDLTPTNNTNLILDVQVTDANGDTITQAFGELEVLPDVTRTLS